MPFDIKDPEFLNRLKVLLIEYREARGFTQKQVYQKTGFHIGRLESTDWDMRLSSFLQLCDLYDIKASFFFNELEKRSANNASRLLAI